MKNKVLQNLRTHFFTVRFALTVTFLQYLFWVRMTDRGDDLLEILAFMVVGLGLALAWVVQTLRAFIKPPRRHLLPLLGIELAATFIFLSIVSSGLPFQMGFWLSRPALDRFASETPLPQQSNETRRIGRQAGLIRVLAIRRDEADNILVYIHSNMSYAHYLVRHPKPGSSRLRHGKYLGYGWYRYSYGM
ncbi:MAG: hypothetical protein V4671_31335 [Armatimonadota bacterium]